MTFLDDSDLQMKAKKTRGTFDDEYPDLGHIATAPKPLDRKWEANEGNLWRFYNKSICFWPHFSVMT